MRLSSTHTFSCDWRRRSLWEHKCCRWLKHAATSPWCDAQAVAHEWENTQTHPPSYKALKSVNFRCFSTARSSLKQLFFFFLSLTNLICFRLKPSDYLLRQLASQPKMKCGEKDCSWGDRSEAIMTNEDVSFFFPLSLLKAFKLMIAFVRVCKMEGRWWTWKGKWERNRSVAKAEREKEEAVTFSPPKKTPMRCILVTILHDQWVEEKQSDISPEFLKETRRNCWIWPTSAPQCVGTCM